MNKHQSIRTKVITMFNAWRAFRPISLNIAVAAVAYMSASSPALAQIRCTATAGDRYAYLSPSVRASAIPLIETTVRCLINRKRQAQGLPLLQPSPKLNAAALDHAKAA